MVCRKPLSRRPYTLVLVLLALILLAGCGSVPISSGATSPSSPHAVATSTPRPPMPMALQIVRFAPHQDEVAPFSTQTEDAAKVQQLFATLRALPPFVLTPTCPNDRGGGYLLSFLEHGRIVVQAVIGAGGCPQVSLSEPYGCHKPTDTTMGQIADTLGVPLAKLEMFYDTAPPGSQVAPEDHGVPLLPFSPCH